MNGSHVDNSFLTFFLNDEEYAINVSFVREIRGWEKSVFLPNTEKFVNGVLNLNGEIIPIIDLRLRFELETKHPVDASSIIIVETDEGIKSKIIGLIVDKVVGVYDIESKNIKNAGKVNGPAISNCVLGLANVNDKFLILIEPNKTLTNY